MKTRYEQLAQDQILVNIHNALTLLANKFSYDDLYEYHSVLNHTTDDPRSMTQSLIDSDSLIRTAFSKAVESLYARNDPDMLLELLFGAQDLSDLMLKLLYARKLKTLEEFSSDEFQEVDWGFVNSFFDWNETVGGEHTLYSWITKVISMLFVEIFGNLEKWTDDQELKGQFNLQKKMAERTMVLADGHGNSEDTTVSTVIGGYVVMCYLELYGRTELESTGDEFTKGDLVKVLDETCILPGGKMVSETQYQSEDGMFGFGGFESPNDIDKVEHLTDWLRLRYSELMGVLCARTTPCSTDPDADKYARMTGHEYQLDCEKDECEFVYHQLATNPKRFNVPGYRPVLDVLTDALKTFHAAELPKEELLEKIKQAIYTGSAYLQKSGVTPYQEITMDYIVRQPLDPEH